MPCRLQVETYTRMMPRNALWTIYCKGDPATPLDGVRSVVHHLPNVGREVGLGWRPLWLNLGLTNIRLRKPAALPNNLGTVSAPKGSVWPHASLAGCPTMLSKWGCA